MNNGVVNNQTSTNNNQATEQSVLTPMAGVTVAPVSSAPVDATKAAQQTVNSQNQAPVQQTAPIPSQQSAQPQQPVLIANQGDTTNTTNNISEPKKRKNRLLPLLFLIIIGLGGYIYYMNQNYTNQINQLNYNCTPITSTKKEIELDVDSVLVKGLYKKVETNIREDLAQPEFNDNMKIYLAYRQILERDKYDTNCQGFSLSAMEPYTCDVSDNFVPKGFHENTLIQKIKELYGEKTEIELTNVQLGNVCLVGYQYIPARKEFVQGFCNQQNATSLKVTKNLTKAISTGNTIILTEEVKYHENEGISVPDSLKSGIYHYTFRLDMNYNYVLVNKTYESKY